MNIRKSDFSKSNNSFTSLWKDTTITAIIIIKSWHIDKFYCKFFIFKNSSIIVQINETYTIWFHT